MIRTRTTLVAAAITAGLALSGCGANTPTAAPPPPSASTTTPTTTTGTPTVAPPPSTTDTPLGTPTTDTPTVDPATAPPPSATAPPVDPAPPVPVTHTPAAPSIPAQPTVPVTHAPSPASLPPAPNPAPVGTPAPAPVPVPAPPVAAAPPRPAPVVQPPPPAPQPAPRPGPAPAPVSSWSGIYDAFVASHPGPTYRVFDTGNYGNTTTNGAGTVVMVSIAPKTPVDILYSVMVHEYGHYRQNHAYGPGLGYAVRAVGSADLDHAADCFALAHGATWVNYGCTSSPAVQGILARMGG